MHDERKPDVFVRPSRPLRSSGISSRSSRPLRSIVTSESARQWVHIGSGLFALLLRYLTWWQAAALAVAALLFNVLVLPHVGGRRLYRPIDEARGFPLGILLYPLSVLILILAFPDRTDIVAAAWAVLAVGDGAATLIGQAAASNQPAEKNATRADSKRTAPAARPADAAGARRATTVVGKSPAGGMGPAKAGPHGEVDKAIALAGAAKLPWNAEKTIAGTAGFFVFGSLAGVALACWTRPAVTPAPPLLFSLVAPIVAAAAGALVEAIPVRLDDNISVPLSASAVLWLASTVRADAAAASWHAVAAYLPWAIVVNIVVALLR